MPDVQKPYIFYPANDWPHKRHSLLLSIMFQLWEEKEDLSLVLTGGHDPSYISSLISHKGFPSDKVINLGYISNDDLV